MNRLYLTPLQLCAFGDSVERVGGIDIWWDVLMTIDRDARGVSLDAATVRGLVARIALIAGWDAPDLNLRGRPLPARDALAAIHTVFGTPGRVLPPPARSALARRLDRLRLGVARGRRVSFGEYAAVAQEVAS